VETLRKLTSQQTGKCGELLVQYQLLKHGVESAPMTTDYGVDLVAFHAAKRKTVTIQVKTSTHRGTVEDKWVIWEIPELVNAALLKKPKGAAAPRSGPRPAGPGPKTIGGGTTTPAVVQLHT